MIIRKVDASNDWTFGKGLSDYAVDEAAIEQNIRGRILSWVGDCFFAPDEGVDWRNRLDVNQQANLLQEIKGIILRSYGVIGVISLSGVFNSPTRNDLVTYNIQTIFSSSFTSLVKFTTGIGS